MMWGLSLIIPYQSWCSTFRGHDMALGGFFAPGDEAITAPQQNATYFCGNITQIF